MGNEEIKKRVSDSAALLRITDYLERYPAQLSAGNVSAWRWPAPSPCPPKCC